MLTSTFQRGIFSFTRTLLAAWINPGRRGMLALVCSLSLSPLCWAQNGPGQHAIASAHPIATAAGMHILQQGGNAFDAAVAVSATLAVVEPAGSGMGGGGFWLLHRAQDQHQVMIDGRERAPLAAHRDMYLDAHGEVVPGLSMNGPLAAGIPGQPAALALIAERYGKLPLATSLAPAIQAAREGFAVDKRYRAKATFRLKAMQADSETARIFLLNNEVPPVGHLVKQPELATVLEAMARNGADGFYRGPVAEQLIRSVRAAGGIWTHEDLQQYRAVERTPIRARIGDIDITTAAPPSSGGIALVTMLNILSAYELETLEDSQRTHLIVEAMRRAYRDRAQYLGDPDFVTIPSEMLTHPQYAAGLRASIHPHKATPSDSLPGQAIVGQGQDTTHFSILDSAGNRVAATLSINYPFGAAFVPPGTGILLNDEMDDFSAKPGVPNAYGLVGAEANAIAPGKRPLSSMSPTFIEYQDQVAILGAPGGSRIISMVLLGGLEFLAGRPVEQWVSRPRFHHQYLPDVIQFESDALNERLQAELTALGHVLKPVSRPYGDMQAILWQRTANTVSAASDPRGVGTAKVQQAD